MLLGQRIRELRSIKGETLKETSSGTNLSVSYLSDIERGRTNPSLQTLETIANHFDISISDLLAGVEFAGELTDNALPPGLTLFAKKNKDLRLLPKSLWKGHAYQSFDGVDSDLAWLVMVGETLKARVAAKKSKVEVEKDEEEIKESILETAEEVLSWEAAREVAKLFEGFNAEAIQLLFNAAYGWQHRSFLKDQAPTEEHVKRLLWIARCMVGKMDDEELDESDTAAKILESLTRTCKVIGVRLPKAMTKMAADFDAQISAAGVATETES